MLFALGVHSLGTGSMTPLLVPEISPHVGVVCDAAGEQRGIMYSSSWIPFIFLFSISNGDDQIRQTEGF